MDIPEYFISCDWGTSNFRLRLVRSESLEIMNEFKTDQGIKTLYASYLEQQEFNQKDFFSNYLLNQIQRLPNEHQGHLIIAAGMASSNIGLYELEYSEMPFYGDGKHIITKQIKLKNDAILLLISGVKNNSGMMRGEETQAIGLENNLSTCKEGILILPGTHSKHLAYENGKFIKLKNFMTGELFEILSKKSILSTSIVKENKNNMSERSFLEGVVLGSEGKLSSSLLSIRANDLFKKATKEDNYFFLSGLLIGDELTYLKNEARKVFLASPYPLAHLYKIALEHIIGVKKYKLFDSETVENAVLIGQKKILQQL